MALTNEIIIMANVEWKQHLSGTTEGRKSTGGLCGASATRVPQVQHNIYLPVMIYPHFDKGWGEMGFNVDLKNITLI